jgi:hypothetical protein
MNPTRPGVLLLTEEQKIANRKEVQRAYYEKTRIPNKDLQSQNSNLNEQIGQSTVYIMTLINERDQAKALLQSYGLLINEKELRIQLLQQENNRLRLEPCEILQPNSNLENAELRKRIENLESTVSQQSQQIISNDSLILQLKSQNSEKDNRISQLQSQLNGCVTTDLNQRLQDLSLKLENKTQENLSCFETINKLNADKSGLMIYRDFLADINSRYPKFLASYAYDLKQPGNQSQYSEINNWAEKEFSKITPNDILPLTSFKNFIITPEPSPKNLGLNTPQVNLNQPVIYNQNVPQVNLQNELADTSNINHPMAGDVAFKRWLYLYHSNNKSPEYKNLYESLRKRYKITPVQVVQQYSKF